jgi:hypothetical protein
MKTNKLLTTLLVTVAVVACNGGGGGGTGTGTGNGGSGGGGSGSGTSNDTLKIVHSMPINQVAFNTNSILNTNLKTGNVFIPILYANNIMASQSPLFNQTALTNINGQWQTISFILPKNSAPAPSGEYDNAFNNCSIASNNNIACVNYDVAKSKDVINEISPSTGSVVNQFEINDGTSFINGDGVLDVENNYFISFSSGYYCELTSGTCTKYSGTFNSLVSTGYYNNSYYAVYTDKDGNNDLKIFTGNSVISKTMTSRALVSDGGMVMMDGSHFKMLAGLNTIYTCTIGDTSVTCDNGINIVAGNTGIISSAQELFKLDNQLYISGANLKIGNSVQSFIYSYNPNRVGGASQLRPLTPPYMRFRIRRF